jgi:hypothetical protein
MTLFVSVVVGLSIATVIAIVIFCVIVIDDPR